MPPHLANRSNASTPPITGKDVNRATPPKANGGPAPANTNAAPGNASSDKAEKERQKKKEKKERKDRERTEREVKEAEEWKDGGAPTPGSAEASTPVQGPKSGKATPIGNASEASTSAAQDPDSDLKSPATESTGARTPTSKKGPRNPWTIFMRMGVPANESELKEFFGEAKGGIVRINYPQSFPGRAQKIAYVEFGDEEAMRAGLEKHAEVFTHSLIYHFDTVVDALQTEIKRHDPRGEASDASRRAQRWWAPWRASRTRSWWSRRLCCTRIRCRGLDKKPQAKRLSFTRTSW